jgi:hypothetical protein
MKGSEVQKKNTGRNKEKQTERETDLADTGKNNECCWIEGRKERTMNKGEETKRRKK